MSSAPEDVARAILDGVERGLDEIFPDAMSRGAFATWRNDPKELARHFHMTQAITPAWLRRRPALDRLSPPFYSCMVTQVSKPRQAKSSGACCSGLSALLSPKLFKALSDSKRLSLFVRMLEECGPCTVGAVAEGSGVDLSVVSRHLAILREAGIISCEKRGKEVFCVVETATIAKLLRELADALEACCPDGRRFRASQPAKGARTKPRAQG